MLNLFKGKLQMPNDWIIDVLMDLKKFSAKNDFGKLADHLDDTIMIATSELSYSGSFRRRMVGGFDEVRDFAGPTQRGDSA